MDFPEIFPVRQILNQTQVADPWAAVRNQILESKIRQRVKPSSRVAVGVGSRGIANIAAMASAAVETLRGLGYQPFIVAAMGSHGGATPDGQRELLASYGVTEQALGVPVRTEMDTVLLGNNSWGEPVYWDRNAFE